MTEPRYLSTKIVARALDVSVTTIKRWVDDGTLPAHKTIGGHRKILLNDVLRLIRTANLPHIDLALLTGKQREAAAPFDLEQVRTQLLAALKAGEQQPVRTLIVQSWEAGVPIEDLADRVIAPAMRGIGHDWETGRIDVLHEHRATQLCASALYELKRRLEPNGDEERPLAVGGCVEGDHYLLATLLIQIGLLDNGWQAVNIGPNTPVASFRRALVELKPRLLWISFSYLPNEEAFLTQYQQLYEEAAQMNTAVAVGGRALTADLRARMRYTTFGDQLTHLLAFARTLHPPPQRLHRG